MKKLMLTLGLALSFLTATAQTYDVAAYLYPAYAAGDARLRPFWPMGIGEWETVLTMQQRYPRHNWDRHPLWGYINEADPAVMEMEIDQATLPTEMHGFDKWNSTHGTIPSTSDNGHGITPTIFTILGIRIPADWRGRPFPEIYVK